jgi:glycosyltransferase involved in cell wall biosynthesis
MKISIIVPVYNGEETIEECLNALINQDYPRKGYEIIIIDGASTDRTPEIVGYVGTKAKKARIHFKYIRNQEREGRLLARIHGAEEATYDLLLFVDSRCIANRSLLKNIKEINYQPIVGNPLVKFDNSISRFYWLIRKALYRRYFGEKFEPVYVGKENFEKIVKGTTVFLCNKELFISSQPEHKHRHVSDDTKLLWNIVQKKKILKHPDIKVTYLPRHSLREEIRHTFQRGPKFVDYYLDLGKEKFWMFIFSPLFLLILTVSLLLVNFTYFLYWLSLSIFIHVSVSIWLSKNIKDFFIVIALLPVVGFVFEMGILKGLTLKMLRVK